MKKRKILLTKLFIVVLSSIMISALSVQLYSYTFIKYPWLLLVFWVSAVSVPRILIEIADKKVVGFTLFIPAAIVLTSAIYFDSGWRVAILGLGVGITYTIALWLNSYLVRVAGDKKK